MSEQGPTASAAAPPTTARLRELVVGRLRQLERSEWLDPAALAEQQGRALAALAEHAQRFSPGFAARLERAGLSAKDLGDVAALPALPPLTRRELQDGDGVYARAIPETHGPTSWVETTGSTGQPVRVMHTLATQVEWLALTLREHRWHGSDWSRPLAAVRANIVEVQHLPDWGTAVRLVARSGPSAMIPGTLPMRDIVAILRALQPGQLVIYPTLLATLCDYLDSSGDAPPALQRLRTIGEMLQPERRRRAAALFAAPVTDLYSSRELGHIAHECPQSALYHVPEGLLVEVLDGAGRPCAEGEEGGIVVTGLRNYATPLVRYAIGDRAIRGGACPCGRGLPTLAADHGTRAQHGPPTRRNPGLSGAGERIVLAAWAGRAVPVRPARGRRDRGAARRHPCAASGRRAGDDARHPRDAAPCLPAAIQLFRRRLAAGARRQDRGIRMPVLTDRARLTRTAALASLATALLLGALKGWAVWATSSTAMLGSLADTALDFVASLATLVGVWVAAHPADAEHRFGHGKAEALAAMFQVILIVLSAGAIAVRAVTGLVAGGRVEAAEQGILVSGIAIAATFALLAWQRHVIRRTGSLAIRTDNLHYRSDLFLNLAVIAALAIDSYLGFAQADPLFALGIAGWLLWGAWRASREAVDNLMDREWPEDKRLRFVERAALHPELSKLHDLRTRTSGHRDFAQFHVDLPPAMTVAEAHAIIERVEADLRDAFPGLELLIHIDPEGHVDEPGNRLVEADEFAKLETKP